MNDALPTKEWTKVTLAECVVEIAQRVDNPAESGYERFVGLDHLETGETSVRNWGSCEDVTSSMKLFKSGDVIVARRNVYLRRAARASFDGVCSGDGIVLRGNPKMCLPDLLPFLLNTDDFWDYVTSQADGTMSKRITVKRLLAYKFTLPPLEEQRRIAQVLQATTECQDLLHELSNCAQATANSFIDHRMRGLSLGEHGFHERVGRYFSGWNLAPLGELITSAQYGLSESLGSTGRYPVLRMMNLENGKATADDLKYLDLSDSDFETYELLPGDVLFNRTNSFELVGRTGVFDLAGDYVFASYLIRVKTKRDLLLPEYLCAFLRAPIGRRQVMSFATRGVSQTNVNASNLKRILIPAPPLEYQQDVVAVLRELDRTQSESKTRLQAARGVASAIINGGLEE